MDDRSNRHGEDIADTRLRELDPDKPGLNHIWLSSDTIWTQASEPESSLPHDPEREGSTSASSAKCFLESVIDEYVVVICASIRVEYKGRASSVADVSQRIVITKPDGTLIIHEDTKHRPLNWQPPGTTFHLSVRDGPILILEAFRKKDRETVTIWFEKVFYIAASRVTPGQFRFSGSESEMVDRVIRDPGLVEEGFTPQKREFRTRYGSVDLIGKDREGNLFVLEFKRGQAQLASTSQLDRYVKYFIEIERLEGPPKAERGEERRTKEYLRTTDRKRGHRESRIRGGIVAPTITAEALTLLKKLGYEFFRLEPRSNP
ncbi:MAG: endonuclease NucS [Thaumarchaeota archaeon]|nr:endonuclease NucS [Nitrososphaerota archaeon]